MWKDEFVSIISGATISLEDIERAMTLKDEHLPPKLYKFRSVNEYAITNLSSDTVWLCSADKYNDPYECCTTLNFEVLHRAIQNHHFDELLSQNNLKYQLSQDEISKIRNADDPVRSLSHALLEKDGSVPQEKHKQIVEALIDAQFKVSSENYQHFNQRAQQGMKICSFSERVDSVVMWGHYANNHQGFCLEYDIESWPPGEVRRRMLYPVIYSDHILDATKHILQSMRSRDFNNLYGAMAAIHKSPDWAYEKEWRFVLPMGESFQDQNYPMPKPSALYLGSRIQKEDKATLLDIARQKGISVYEVALSPTEFKLEPRRYDDNS
ncbi:DUF2971 domain-containing protein [Thioalkalivibrio sp. ARh3]|uniref:DUF2971 domain-containing protein n=1 Tax=Thioalkalivibrio sp. ARh3 TaxID=1158148 RepID=UPI0009D9B0FC|nr:DUF2971 domain-containing protein [Thioalkalivibrio sp. ARh3]